VITGTFCILVILEAVSKRTNFEFLLHCFKIYISILIVMHSDILIISDSWQEEPWDVATVKLEELATEEHKLRLNR
jgi:hypothetical protein